MSRSADDHLGAEGGNDLGAVDARHQQDFRYYESVYPFELQFNLALHLTGRRTVYPSTAIDHCFMLIFPMQVNSVSVLTSGRSCQKLEGGMKMEFVIGVLVVVALVFAIMYLAQRT